MEFKYSHGATVGRYRPPHNGHFYLQDRMLEDCAKITILIGSAQEEGTDRNLFSIEDVEQMLVNYHRDNLARITIIKISDINNPPEWANHVLGTIGKNIDAYYCGSTEDAECFLGQTEYDVVILDRYKLSQEFNFKSGTEIRQMIFDNNSECQKYVPECNEKYLRRMLIPGQG